MKKIIPTLFLTFFTLFSFAQIDSVSFVKSGKAEIKTTNVEEITVNKTKIKTDGEVTEFISINDDCNYILPKYSQLTDGGEASFRKIKLDVQASLSALGSSLTFEKKSDFYVYYFTRAKNFYCPVTTFENKISYGVGLYVILKVSDLKVKLDLKTPYDISAAGQLGLAKVELDVRTFGMTPSLANEFLPEKLSNIAIEAAKYFDKLLENTKIKINDKNTIPTLIPIQL